VAITERLKEPMHEEERERFDNWAERSVQPEDVAALKRVTLLFRAYQSLTISVDAAARLTAVHLNIKPHGT
jgi:hypothetical protein